MFNYEDKEKLIHEGIFENLPSMKFYEIFF